jgi:hypothetical protein
VGRSTGWGKGLWVVRQEVGVAEIGLFGWPGSRNLAHAVGSVALGTIG